MDAILAELKPTLEDTDKRQYEAWTAWLEQSYESERINVAEAISKKIDEVELDADEEKSLKAWTDIFGNEAYTGGAFSLAIAGVATLGAVFLLWAAQTTDLSQLLEKEPDQDTLS